MNLLHPTWIEIDVTQFKKNLSAVKKRLNNSLYCLPVKANAYGHGLCSIAKIAEESGVHYLAVSNLNEGITLRQNGISIPILVLGAFALEQIPYFISYDLEFTLSSLFKAEAVLQYCKETKKICKVHLEVDTGMQRTGVRAQTLEQLYEFVRKHKEFQLIGIYSHFAIADEVGHSFTQEQINIFENILKKLKPPKNVICHIANSGGVSFYPSSYLHMARPGLISYGVKPHPALQDLDIASCFSLKSKISYFKVVEKGVGISYSHTYKTSQQTRIVTIPIGYGDGYRRGLSNKGSVLIRGKRYPIVGNICMDQLMVDIGLDEAYVGDEVVLIGKQGNEEITLEDMAQLYHSIPYEVLCSFNERIPRVYVES
jgi:alanine racemase